MKKLILNLIMVLGTMSLYAQQSAQYSQFMSNKLIQNPAYAGNYDFPSVTALYRTQWVGLEGAPNTQTLSAHMPLFKNRVGIGLTFLRDDITITNHQSFGMAYAYKMDLGRGRRLSLGIQGTIKSINVDWQELKSFEAGDGAIPTEVSNRLLPNASIGAYLSTNKYYVGISMQNMITAKLDLQNQDLIDILPNDAKHFYLMGGLRIPMSSSIDFMPATLIKYVKNAPIDINLNTSFVFHKRLWLGVSYRVGDSVNGLAQFQISKQLKAGFAYDFTLSEIRQVSTGTYEIMMEYNLDYKRQQVSNPRFF